MTSKLIASGLRKTFSINGRKNVAVDNFSVSVAPGEIIALVGESGSGKSTIARMMVGLETPDSGTIKIEKAGSSHDPTRAEIQMVFQDPFASLNPVHTIGQHLFRPLKCLPSKHTDGVSLEEAAHTLLESVELKPANEYLPRFPSALSGGQRQRVAIARALAPDPMFLIADEPTSMLDVSTRGEVLNLFRKLAKGGLGVILITHDLLSVAALADRIFVLKDGHCVESGSSLTLLKTPNHHYTRELLSSVPDPDGRFLESNHNLHPAEDASILNDKELL